MVGSTGRGVRSGRSQEIVGVGSPSAVQKNTAVRRAPKTPVASAGSVEKVGGTDRGDGGERERVRHHTEILKHRYCPVNQIHVELRQVGPPSYDCRPRSYL